MNVDNDRMTLERLAEIQARVDKEAKALRICARCSPCPSKCPRYKLKMAGAECARQLMERSAESLETETDLLAEVRRLSKPETMLAGAKEHFQIALDFAGELQATIDRLTAQLATVTRERDAAVRDMVAIANDETPCNECANYDPIAIYTNEKCDRCVEKCAFVWRGICADNASGNTESGE